MSDYAAPPGDALVFAGVSQPYTAPPGHDLRFAVWSQWLDIAGDFRLGLTFQAAASLSAAVSGEFDLGFSISGAAELILPVAGAFDLSLSVSGAASLILPVAGDFAPALHWSAWLAESWYIPAPFVGGQGGVALRWSPQERLDPPLSAGWTQAPPQEPRTAIGWDAPRLAEQRHASPWRHTPKRERPVAIPWADLVGHPQAAPRLPYTAPPVKNRERLGLPWGDVIAARDRQTLAGYTYPPPRDEDWSLPWGAFEALALTIGLPYTAPPPKDREITIVSGPYWYPRWCIWQYPAPRGDQLIFRFATLPAYLAPPGHALVFAEGQEAGRELICYDGTWNGPKDAYWYRPRPWPIIKPDIRSYYIIMNTISLKRVADNLPIPIQSLEIATDHDSWCWSLRATLRRAVDLDMVRPMGGAPVAVEAQINGYAWQFIVEEYGDERRFGQRSFSISGRSLSAGLAAPYSRPLSVMQPAQRTAAQLADEALHNLGYSIDWQLPDWLVPGGAYSATQQTPMQQLIHIAQAAGGVVHSDPSTPTISLLPWYPAMPWEWGAVAVEAVLPTWQERRTAYQPAPQYSGVYVGGQNQGVMCFVRRAGTDGAEQPQMQTHPLVTATEAGLALGKKILADSGPRSIESISAPLLENPGLLAPGKIIQVIDPAGNWRGMVLRTRLSAQRPTVTQQIDVLRYHGS